MKLNRERIKFLAHFVLALVLLPVLVCVLWLEVELGAGFTWGAFVGYISPNDPNDVAGLCFLIATLVGPASMIVAAFLTRHRTMSAIDRLLHIEALALFVATPFVCLGFVLAAASAGVM